MRRWCILASATAALGYAITASAASYSPAGNWNFANLSVGGQTVPQLISSALNNYTPVDSTARLLAQTAKSEADGALQSSLAGVPNGYPQLDSNKLIPPAQINPISVATDPVARTAANAAIPKTALGQANGAAQLGPDGTLSTNTVTPSWTGAIASAFQKVTALTLYPDYFGTVGVGGDDTAAFQAAINAAVSSPRGYVVAVHPGTYILTAPLKATLTANNGLTLAGAGSSEVMLVDQFPVGATDFNMFELNIGQNNSLNSEFRMPNGGQGQYAKIGGFSAMQNDAIGRIAGNVIYAAASQASFTPTVPDLVASDIIALPGAQVGNDVIGVQGQNQSTGNGINSGFGGWQNGLYLNAVGGAVIKDLKIYAPNEAGVAVNASPFGTCNNGANSEIGYTYVAPITVGSTTYAPYGSCGFVAGAAVLVNSPIAAAGTSFGIQYTGGEVKGYMAAMAVGGSNQGDSISGVNTYNDYFGVMLGGGQILEQQGGKTVVAQGSVTSTFNNPVTSATITLGAANASIVPGMQIEGTFMPLGAVVTAVNGTSVTFGAPNGASFTVGGSATESLQFTNGVILTSPSGTGSFGASFACDDWGGCISAPTDPNSYISFGNIVASLGNMISNDASPNWIGFNLGRSGSHQVTNSDWYASLGSASSQQFLVATGPVVSTTGSVQVSGNTVNAGGSTLPPIQLTTFGQASVNNNLITASVVGQDSACTGTWGFNTLNGAVTLGVPGCAGLSYDAAKNLSVPGFVAGSFAGGTSPIAGTGTTQTGATQLTAQNSVISCAAGATAYLVPATTEVGDAVAIDNVGSNACLIYPQTGAQLAYDLTPNQAFSLPPGSSQMFVLQTATSFRRANRNPFGDSFTAPLLINSGSSIAHSKSSVVENFFSPSGTLTTSGGTPGTGNLGPLQIGFVRAYGRVTCTGNGTYAAWNVDGLWGGSTFGPISGAFAATAAYGTVPSGWAVTPASLAGPSGAPATSGYVELAVTSGQSSYNLDCTGTIDLAPNQ